jgi:autotransporter-associated beta strand protein
MSRKCRDWSFQSCGSVFLKMLSAGMMFLLDGSPAVAQQRVLGTDISYWNCGTSATGISQANWNTAYTTGNRVFCQIRSTRGGTTGLGQTSGTPGNPTQETLSRRYDDPRFLQNITRATVAGMVTGPYHFSRPDIAGNTGTDEANHFLEMAGIFMRPGYMMPMYDLEATDGDNVRLVQFSLDFSERIYAVMQIRPCIYINGNYSSLIDNGSTAAQDIALAQPPAYTPSVVGPAYPMLWNARYSDNTTNPAAIPVQTGSPKHTYTTVSAYYGPWDNFGNSEPWAFWQYGSVFSIPGINAVDATVDGDVCHGDIEYLRNYLIPAVWWSDTSGDWSTLLNWNSGQPAPVPVTPVDQTPPYAYTTNMLPVPRLPGAAGSGPISGQYDTVILERPNANITVTLSTGAHNIRKLYVRETLNLTGGSLAINYDPTYRPDDSALVLHGGPLSAQFSGPVALSNSASLLVHTLQVDTNRTFTLAGGTVAFSAINLMPHVATPAKILMVGNVTFNARSNTTAVIARGGGPGNSGWIDLGNGTQTFTVGNGTNDVDLSVNVPISNGGLTKAGLGTLRFTTNNSYGDGTTVSAGRLLVNNTSGSGTGSGAVTVNGGILAGIGSIAGVVAINGEGTISPGTSIGTLTLNSAPVFNGTNFMEVNRNGGAPLADKIILTSGTLNYGGTLVVSNAGAALVGGEVFALFNAPAYSGAFVSSNLPALTTGLNWDLSSLTVNGSIKVNRGPVAGAASFTNHAPEVLQIPIATLINAASDADGDALTLAGVNLTTTNGVTLTTNGAFIVYSNYVSVADQLSYTLSDGHGGSVTGMVQIAASPTGRFAGAPSGTGGAMTLHFVGSPGWTYYLDRSTNLAIWATIWTNVAPANGLFDYTDDFHELGAPAAAAFYRLSW